MGMLNSLTMILYSYHHRQPVSVHLWAFNNFTIDTQQRDEDKIERGKFSSLK